MARTKRTEVSTVVNNNDEIKQLETRLALLRNGGTDDIPMNAYIRVMSLFPGHLNLSTQERGLGKVFRFENFGSMKRMLYSDLIDVLEAYSKFANAGYFIILDPRVIRNHGLEDAYAKVLTKEKIESIISGSSDAHELFSACNARQQNLIVSMLIEKIRDNPESVDLNMIDRISRLAGVDIAKKAAESREFFNLDNQETDEKQQAVASR